MNPLVPSVHYAFENVLISLTTLFVAWCSFCLTLYVILPLSFIKAVIFNPKPQDIQLQDKPAMALLVVGASWGLGFSVLKQYAKETDAVIVVTGAAVGQYLCTFRYWARSDI